MSSASSKLLIALFLLCALIAHLADASPFRRHAMRHRPVEESSVDDSVALDEYLSNRRRNARIIRDLNRILQVVKTEQQDYVRPG